MKCPDCGADTLPEAKFCPTCGHPFLGAPLESELHKDSRDNQTRNAIVAITIAVVVFVVVSATYYTLFMPRTIVDGPPAVTYAKSSVAGGVKITIVSITKTDVPWDDVWIQLTDGTYFAQWSPRTSDLDGGAAVTAGYPSQSLWIVSVNISVTDLSGNGYISGADSFILTTGEGFRQSATYQACLIYIVTGEKMGIGITFSG